MSTRRKQGLVDEATKLILDAEAGDRDTKRVWIHVHEIPDGNWGAAGQVIMFAQPREAAEHNKATVDG